MKPDLWIEIISLVCLVLAGLWGVIWFFIRGRLADIKERDRDNEHEHEKIQDGIVKLRLEIQNVARDAQEANKRASQIAEGLTGIQSKLGSTSNEVLELAVELRGLAQRKT